MQQSKIFNSLDRQHKTIKISHLYDRNLQTARKTSSYYHYQHKSLENRKTLEKHVKVRNRKGGQSKKSLADGINYQNPSVKTLLNYQRLRAGIQTLPMKIQSF